MELVKKWKAFWNPAIALAFDRERLWSVGGPEGEPHGSAAWVALSKKDRKVVAVGDDALRARNENCEGLITVNYSRHGSLIDFDVAEVAIRHELRWQLKSGLRIAPRVLVATSSGEVEKRVVKDAVVHAGARDIITIPRLMAAAIGAGIDVAKNQAETVVYVDRDWCGFAVIGGSRILATWESLDSLDHVVVDRAWRERMDGDEKPVDFDVGFRRLMRQGAANDPACTAFARRLLEHYRIALATIAPAVATVAKIQSLYLVGPCAHLPGLEALLASTWGRKVVVPSRAEEAVILGCRTVLGELDEVMKSFQGLAPS
jgi:hypothetical protein